MNIFKVAEAMHFNRLKNFVAGVMKWEKFKLLGKVPKRDFCLLGSKNSFMFLSIMR
jgi:hypothetical protein